MASDPSPFRLFSPPRAKSCWTTAKSGKASNAPPWRGIQPPRCPVTSVSDVFIRFFLQLTASFGRGMEVKTDSEEICKMAFKHLTPDITRSTLDVPEVHGWCKPLILEFRNTTFVPHLSGEGC